MWDGNLDKAYQQTVIDRYTYSLRPSDEEFVNCLTSMGVKTVKQRYKIRNEKSVTYLIVSEDIKLTQKDKKTRAEQHVILEKTLKQHRRRFFIRTLNLL